MIRLLVADDHEVVRCGIRSVAAGTEIEVVGEAANGMEAVKLALALNPDVLLLDVRMPEVDGLDALSRVKVARPQLPVLILSTYDNPTYLARAAALGAAGYVLKDAPRTDLLSAIRRTAAGQKAWPEGAMRRAAAASKRISDQLDVPLTERELDVLRHAAQGLNNREIARALHISHETVKEHLRHVMRKIGVKDRTQAAVWAVRQGLV